MISNFRLIRIIKDFDDLNGDNELLTKATNKELTDLKERLVGLIFRINDVTDLRKREDDIRRGHPSNGGNSE